MPFHAESLLGPEGLLAETLESCEYRPQQVQMAEHIWQVLQNENTV